VTGAAFAAKLAQLLGLPSSAVVGKVSANGVVTIEFVSSNGNATTEAAAALNLGSSALTSLGAASVTSLAPATTAAPSDSASDNLPLIIGCAVGGFVLLVIILLVVKKSSSGGSGANYLEDDTPGHGSDQPMLTVPQQQTGNRNALV
jgi:hypothetical protein